MCGVDKTKEGGGGGSSGKRRDVFRKGDANGWSCGKCRIIGGFPILNAPMSCAEKVFGDAFEASVMDGSWGVCKLGKESNSVAGVGTTCDVGVEKFTKEGAEGEALFGLKSSSFFGIFRGTDRGEKFGETIWGQRFMWLGRLVRLFPLMGLEDAVNVVRARDEDVVIALSDSDTIVFFDQSKVIERRFRFTGEL